MREQLIVELTALKQSIVAANSEVYLAARELVNAKDELRLTENSLIVDGLIDGKNAEIRSAQMYANTVVDRQNVADAEDSLESAKMTLNNLQTELRITLALVELVKGVA
ncbi:hypothetical protein [Desulfosporosinus youngiae]|uniref:Uncharacterized protein n=1 Tax=Desulfosporosinus youngiae DSM 17734 TaxID=768710 RepID=H5Y244_9FIRM|nr:hypothetical protein [Desulfosporosinus youngiae]EHQ88242.1 hypothetical protein DesyoDRAFT_1071 [Desulfosporosinus youngiae DSM 17734]